jgi:hypothetical protein
MLKLPAMAAADPGPAAESATQYAMFSKGIDHEFPTVEGFTEGR